MEIYVSVAKGIGFVLILICNGIYIDAKKTTDYHGSIRGLLSKSLQASHKNRGRSEREERRGLQESILDFVPQSCNDALLTDGFVCTTNWTSKFGNDTTFMDRVTIPCGECIVMDSIHTIITLEGGIDIIGKLVIPEGVVGLIVKTPLVVVQGELEITTAGKPVDGNPSVTFMMTGDTELVFEPHGENKNNCGEGQVCVAGMKAIVVAGGRMNVRGLPPKTPTWLRLYDVLSNDDASTAILVLPMTTAERWDVGAEILITSHTNSWQDQTVRRITQMKPTEDDEDRYYLVYLDEPILIPSTILQSTGDFATQVALLSRNVVFESESRVTDEGAVQGGHFMIYYTPKVEQYIEGIEIRNFGQQKMLGRYPLHFHFCQSVKGSVVAKNTIRQSNQRCIVVHGTDNLLVSENIAYDTTGHCFMTEDGIETGNEFFRNLGALTKKQPFKILDDDSDDKPSTFWITNPTNNFTRNVAAGSEGSGFWIEPLKRGIRRDMYPDIRPEFDPLTAFDFNIAHSNADFGVRTYPHGYNPRKLGNAVFRGLKIYRNMNGILIHGSFRIIITDSLFADNVGLNIAIDKTSDSAQVWNSTVIGYSTYYDEMLKWQDKDPNQIKETVCGKNDEMLGIRLYSVQANPNPNTTNTLIKNVTMSGFRDTPCSMAYPFGVIENANFEGQAFSTFPLLDDVNITDSEAFVNLCSDLLPDVYLNIINSSISDWAGHSAKTILSDRQDMLEFMDTNKCFHKPDHCYSLCVDTCVTTVFLRIDPMSTKMYKMKVCRENNSSNCVILDGFLDPNRTPDDVRFRRYLASLPPGQYTAVAIDETGSQVWPNFIWSNYDGEEVCPSDYPRSEVAISVPNVSSDKCVELLRNKNFEESDDTDTSIPRYWVQIRKTNLTISPGLGNNGTAAVKVINEDEFKDEKSALIQFVDSRCLQSNVGKRYILSAYVKMTTREGEPMKCDPSDCPAIGIAVQHGSSFSTLDAIESGPFFTVANVVTPTPNANGFYHISGSVHFSTTLSSFDRAFFYVQAKKMRIMYVDDVSVSIPPDF